MKKNLVNALPGIVLLTSLLVAVSTSADQAHERRMMIAIDDGTDGQVMIDLDDSGSAVATHDMQLGETRSLTDAQGRSVLITRTEDGLEMNVDGKIIEVPVFEHGAHGNMTATLVADDVDVDIDVARAVHVEQILGDDITIISGNAIDQATQDSIRSILSSSGHTGDVVFIDRELHEGAAGLAHDVRETHRIKVISREVNATN